MKIKLDIDVSPEELRTFFGLPDVAPLQREMMDKIRENLMAGAQGFDPLTLMKPMLPPHLQSMDAFQKFWSAFAAGGTEGSKD